jgi:hypothetical protein
MTLVVATARLNVIWKQAMKTAVNKVTYPLSLPKIRSERIDDVFLRGAEAR